MSIKLSCGSQISCRGDGFDAAYGIVYGVAKTDWAQPWRDLFTFM